MRSYLPLIEKYFITHMHGLAVFVKERHTFAQDLSPESSLVSYLFSTGFTSRSVLLFFLYQSSSLSLCMIFYFTSSNINEILLIMLLMWKWMGLFLRKNHLLRCWGWFSLPNWSGALTLSLLLKVTLRKLELWFVLWSFFLLKLLCISVNLTYDHAWNTVVMSGLVFKVVTWNCWTSYKSRYAALLVFHLLPLLKPWVIVKM